MELQWVGNFILPTISKWNCVFRVLPNRWSLSNSQVSFSIRVTEKVMYDTSNTFIWSSVKANREKGQLIGNDRTVVSKYLWLVQNYTLTFLMWTGKKHVLCFHPINSKGASPSTFIQNYSYWLWDVGQQYNRPFLNESFRLICLTYPTSY